MFCVLQLYNNLVPLLSQRSHSKSSCRSHSSSSSCGSRDSRFQSMSNEDFEVEAIKHGYMRSRRTTGNEATLGGCCDTGYFSVETTSNPHMPNNWSLCTRTWIKILSFNPIHSFSLESQVFGLHTMLLRVQERCLLPLTWR